MRVVDTTWGERGESGAFWAYPSRCLIVRSQGSSAQGSRRRGGNSFLPTWQGLLHPAVVLDAFSRRVVGWAMAEHLRAELVVGALKMALERRRPGEGVVHHSDRGYRYTSLAFGLRCRRTGIGTSMGSTGDCYENALAESFFAALECELIRRGHWRTHTEARLSVFEFIEGFHNAQGRHSALGYLSPADFERRSRPEAVAEP